jgi:hypothetical protein
MIETAIENYEEQTQLESLRHAELITVILNAPHSKRKDKRLYEVGDFYKPPSKKKQKMTIEQYELALKQQTIAMGGKVNYK